jgi:hypothetical protein
MTHEELSIEHATVLYFACVGHILSFTFLQYLLTNCLKKNSLATL